MVNKLNIQKSTIKASSEKFINIVSEILKEIVSNLIDSKNSQTNPIC